MDMLNVEAIGYIQPRDAEPRYTQAGTPVLTFRMVCNRKRRDRDGEMVDQAEWLQVTVFGGIGEAIANYALKGTRVYVAGRLSSREWTTQDGERRTALEIVANEVILLGSGNGQRPDGERGAAPRGSQRQTERYDDPGLEDLPF